MNDKGESPYWQHDNPLRCPKGHKMIWLGSAFWICGTGKCNTIFVQEVDDEIKRADRKTGN